ncbi:RimK family protein [Oxalobacteraceae bacterium]|nr:RimK family protein [Oxalobacteraceae bacterium]
MPTAKLSIAPSAGHAAAAPHNNDSAASPAGANDAEPPSTPRGPGTPLLVLESLKDRPAQTPARYCMTAADYLAAGARQLPPGSTVINLCRGYKYLSVGYYCSLLAEARGHRVYPSIKSINDLSRKAAYQLDTIELDLALNAALAGQSEHAMPAEFALDIFFGSTDYTLLSGLARGIFATFAAPLMRVEFERGEQWHISAIKMLSVSSLDARQQTLFAQALRGFKPDGRAPCGAPRKWRYHVAVLRDEREALPPSNQGALDKFVEAGRGMEVQVTLIDKTDYADLAKFDALFIRETTAIQHHTYLFAKKAESEGLVVIDDANSILRCTNKIYLADLLRLHDIPTPRSYVLQRDALGDIARLEAEIGYPMVMKVPDGAFSRGVTKAANREEFLRTAEELLKHSSLILVQEYLYTSFDWRIGILNRQVIFASQYFMSKGHWQVAKRDTSGKAEFGMSRAVALDAVPAEILQRASQAAGLIGDGLYGVDMKMCERGAVVIEVNDNPNIDAGNEDGVAGGELYRTILGELVRRVEQARQRAA